MTKSFDPTKPCQTRDGRPARILCTDLVGDYPIVAAVPRQEDGLEILVTTKSDGSYSRGIGGSFHDLVNIPVEHERFGAILEKGYVTECFYRTFESVVGSYSSAFGYIKITYNEDWIPIRSEIIPKTIG